MTHVSKRSLGEGYIVATGVVLAAVLAGMAFQAPSPGLFWFLGTGLSVVVLVGAGFWLKRLELGSEQVWLVSNCSALGLGLGTTVLVVGEVATGSSVATPVSSAVLCTALATTAVVGTLGGVVFTLHRSNRDLRGQNAVLHRVLRHNLRNDMSVVMCLLDEIEANTDGETATTAWQAREKIRSFVRLTDSVRQANVGTTDPTKTSEVRDLADIVESRVTRLVGENPELTVETELADQALVSVGETFELVVDNIVESALSDPAAEPHLLFKVERDGESVRLLVEDDSGAIPNADLSAVAAGSETALEHGHGVELWLVEWLVDASGGDVTIEMDGDVHRVTIELDRAHTGWL